MLRVLLKKQLFEVFKGYFYDAKKNRARSKGGIIGYFIFFLVLMVGMLGGMFAYLSFSLCSGLSAAGVNWLFLAMMELIAIALGAFGSVFNTYSGLYKSKDNDLLLSMPIPSTYIVISRILNVYLMGLMYSAVAFIPAVIVNLVINGFTLSGLLGGILMMIDISVIVLCLSCILGLGVAKLSTKIAHKSVVTVIASIGFIALYYFVYFKASLMLRELIANAVIYGGVLHDKVYPIYLAGIAAEGKLIPTIVCLLVSLALLALTFLVLSRSFLKITTTADITVRKVYREKRANARSISGALFYKELKRFTGSANYMLNCGLGILLMPIFGIVLLVKGSTVMALVAEIGEPISTVFPILAVVAIGMIGVMIDMAAPSVSLEGKSLWILQSLPVSAWDILKAKFSLQVVLGGVPTVICGLCMAVILHSSLPVRLLVILVPLAQCLLMAVVDLSLGLKMHNLNWTNEIAPIKQSMAVGLSLLLCTLYSGLIGAGAFLAYYITGVAVYLLIVLVVTLILTGIMVNWLKKRGTIIFVHL